MVSRVVLAIVLGAVAVSAQPPVRRATNIAALLTYPGFYHQRPILLVGKVSLLDDGRATVAGEGGSLTVVATQGAPEGVDEIRGELWDLGRMKVDDPRLGTVDIRRVFHIDPEGVWPKPGEVLALFASAVAPAAQPTAPTIRSIVLFPARYLDQKVTVVGQFEGRNLAGDLPDAPGRSRDDFVLRAADASIWVTNIRPKGKGFDLALDRRIDTGRWLQVTGTVQQGRGLQWLDAEAGTLELGKPPAESPPAETTIVLPPGPPPEVVFSAPTEDETDVSPTTTVRVQFSRDIDPATLKNRVRAQYVAAAGAPANAADQPIALTTNYIPANRELVITFARPLERFRTVKIDFAEGVLGTDKQPVKPWVLTFQTG